MERSREGLWHWGVETSVRFEHRLNRIPVVKIYQVDRFDHFSSIYHLPVYTSQSTIYLSLPVDGRLFSPLNPARSRDIGPAVRGR